MCGTTGHTHACCLQRWQTQGGGGGASSGQERRDGAKGTPGDPGLEALGYRHARNRERWRSFMAQVNAQAGWRGRRALACLRLCKTNRRGLAQYGQVMRDCTCRALSLSLARSLHARAAVRHAGGLRHAVYAGRGRPCARAARARALEGAAVPGSGRAPDVAAVWAAPKGSTPQSACDAHAEARSGGPTGRRRRVAASAVAAAGPTGRGAEPGSA
mmetsp:Transcript_5089/g.15460  ORF Transcript_5089/g.15460 Transcript_5089/m.15460 type:complete len:215 (+) Transcript_5089:1175-1819(+)